MKKFLTVVALLALAGGAAYAAENAGGTIFAHDANLVYTVDTASYCGLGTPPSSCEGADVNLEGTSNDVSKVWKVYAAFCPNSSPRLKGICFGVYYDESVNIRAWGPCVGDLNNGGSELPGPGWPQSSGTGSCMVFQNTLTGLIDEVYWFAGYSYYSTPALFHLGPHPDPILGGKFADDQVPSLLDDIAGYGTLGFDEPGATACPTLESCGGGPLQGACCTDPDGDGVPNVCTIMTQADCEGAGGIYQGDDSTCDPNPCPQPQLQGACCTDPDGDGTPNVCTVMTAAECERAGGIYQGDNTTCDPNPCPQPVPVHESTWGQIKANYR